jgi:hypothetical protein
MRFVFQGRLYYVRVLLFALVCLLLLPAVSEAGFRGRGPVRSFFAKMRVRAVGVQTFSGYSASSCSSCTTTTTTTQANTWPQPMPAVRSDCPDGRCPLNANPAVPVAPAALPKMLPKAK